MLSLRITSALIGIPLVLGISYLGGSFFNLIVLGIILLGLYEYGNIIKRAGRDGCQIIMYLGAVLTAGSFSYPEYLPLIIFVLICFLLSSMIFFEVLPEGIIYSFFGIFYVAWTLSHLMIIRQNLPQGFEYILLLLIITWSTDTGAYFVGRLFGRHKLSPRISPNKTIEGAVGGIMICVAAVWVFNKYFYILPLRPLVVLAVLGSVIGQLGDLAESAFKRWAGIKDSGNIIPGHGGILDRFDSLILVTPLVYYYVTTFIIHKGG